MIIIIIIIIIVIIIMIMSLISGYVLASRSKVCGFKPG